MKALYKIFMFAGIIAMVSACNEDPEYYTLEDQPDEMHVKANTESIILTAAESGNQAIHLTWDAIKSADPVTYMVRFYATANKNEDFTEFFEVGSATEFSITHNDLNSIVARWALPGDEISVTAQVVGTINNELHYIKPQVSTVEFTAVGWEKYPTNLFLHFTTDKGTSVTKLSQRKLGTGVYETQMAFTPGTFHFTKTDYNDYPAYYMGENGLLKYVDAESEGLMEFSCTQSGTFTIMVDVNDEYLDVQFLDINMPAGANPSIVGDGTEIGWNTKVALSYFTQSENPRTPYIYTWTGQFYAKGEFPEKSDSEGTFKILLADEYGGNCFFAPENNANPLENHELKPYRTQGSSDYKWLVPQTGKYTFTIDVMNMTTSFEPAN